MARMPTVHGETAADATFVHACGRFFAETAGREALPRALALVAQAGRARKTVMSLICEHLPELLPTVLGNLDDNT
eukprot:7164909-Prymnesium_polylepis.1